MNEKTRTALTFIFPVLFLIFAYLVFPYACARITNHTSPHEKQIAEDLQSLLNDPLRTEKKALSDKLSDLYSFDTAPVLIKALSIKYGVSTNVVGLLYTITGGFISNDTIETELYAPILDKINSSETPTELSKIEKEIDGLAIENLIPALSKTYGIPEKTLAALVCDILIYHQAEGNSL